jgi:pantoate--beta-alanine ligase
LDIMTTRADCRRLKPYWRAATPLVLVPTMGALHEGHLALVKIAAELGPVVVSIYVNPAQFGPREDFEAYPRHLERDLDMLRPLGVAAVFAPHAAEMYPQEAGVMVDPGPAANPLCGVLRPGHFRGVLSAVAKLFNLLRPEMAVFGRKDAQQCLVIAEMVRDLAFPVRLLDHPTVRECDGLAMSSRNAYLSSEDRHRALCLSRALSKVMSAMAAGQRSCRLLQEILREAMAPADVVEYAEVRRIPDLAPLKEATGHLLVAIAARIGQTRLIDNLVLRVEEGMVREVPIMSEHGCLT